ncbi:pseudouridine synthase [Verrucomicrobiota bacterium]
MKSKPIRLQKFLAERGIASRRQCEKYITQGLVTVNGSIVTKPGTCIEPGKDKIFFDGQHISAQKKPCRTIMFYKPRGFICSVSSRQGRTIYEFLKDIKERLVPVGRLDKNSEGLLLMSNDGELVNHLTHPRFQQKKSYHVTVSGSVDNATLKKLRSRLVIDGYQIQPAEVRILKQAEKKQDRVILEFVLKEGRNRQIRKMCDHANLKIHRLTRTKVGKLTLKGLKPGQWRDLTKNKTTETCPKCCA